VTVLTSLIFAAVAGAHFAPPPLPSSDRLSQAVDDSTVRRLEGSLHPLARPEFDAGRVEGGLPLQGVSLVFRPSAAQQASLDALLLAQEDPLSPDYRKWITPEEYAQQFGLSKGDLARVSDWLASKGFGSITVSRNRLRVSFAGTVRTIEDAFRTEIHFFDVGGTVHFANATELSLPAALTDLVLTVRNLDDFRPHARSVSARSVPAIPDFTSSVSGNHFLAPDDFATIYDLKPLYAANLDGSGESIAVVGQSAIALTDIETFQSLSGLSVKDPQLVLVPNTGTSTVETGGDEIESDLDLEWSGAVARGAEIVFVYVGNNTSYSAFDALDYAVENDVATVISVSYGNCEAAVTQQNADVIEQWAQQANAQGETISAASGDTGAADCDSQKDTAATGGLAVDLPAAIPEVTGLGGTEFSGDVANPAAYWSATNNADNGSALSYIPEVVWNDTASAGTLAASGGGASLFFTKPSWQDVPGVPNDGARDVPDLALSASAAHDGYLICGPGFCVSPNGYRESPGGDLDVIGGTSVAAPTFAGILAIVNQAAGSHGLGNANPAIYKLSVSTPAAFHPVTSGNNIVPCTPSTSNCPATPPYVFGFTAGSGYSPTAGLGSVDAHTFVLGMAGTTIPQAATSTAISVPNSPVTGGSTIAFAATVSSSSTATAISGSLQFSVDLQSFGPPVTVSNGQATLATVLATGTHQVSASYLGSANFKPSTSGTVAVTVTGGSLVSVAGASTVAPPNGTIVFTASGGTPPYTWSLTTDASGGSVTGGIYKAGSKGGVADVVQVSDSAGNEATIGVTVTSPLTITGSGSSPPRGTITFAAQGGSGTGYVFTVKTNNSGATMDGSVYTAGAKGNVLDVVEVEDSVGSVANTNVLVGPSITVNPATITVGPHGTVSFTATGGSGTGYSWSVTSTGAAGTIDASTGAYVAGASTGVYDMVVAQDSLGNVGTATVTVGAPGSAGGCGSAGGGGASSLLWLALALGSWRRRRARSNGDARAP
jgi:hypothetical protein